jgi:ribosomal protein S18 acetylase RimI-like enzyme
MIKKITVEVNPEQEAALNLYKNSGFQIISQFKMVLGDGKEHDVYQLQMLANTVL